MEYAELQMNHKGEKGITKLLQENLTRAYVTGYMYGKTWISPEEMTQVNLHLGEIVAKKVRQGFKGSKSRGIAFADVLAHISVIGTVDGSVAEKDDEQGVVVVEVAGVNSWGTHVTGRVTVALPAGG